MSRRLFFLKQEGWFEVEMTGNLLNCSLDELIGWAYDMMERCHYRNYIIKEGPQSLPSLQDGVEMARCLRKPVTPALYHES